MGLQESWWPWLRTTCLYWFSGRSTGSAWREAGWLDTCWVRTFHLTAGIYNSKKKLYLTCETFFCLSHRDRGGGVQTHGGSHLSDVLQCRHPHSPSARLLHHRLALAAGRHHRPLHPLPVLLLVRNTCAFIFKCCCTTFCIWKTKKHSLKDGKHKKHLYLYIYHKNNIFYMNTTMLYYQSFSICLYNSYRVIV